MIVDAQAPSRRSSRKRLVGTWHDRFTSASDVCRERSMTTQPDHLLIAWWAKNLDELDPEIVKLASLCQVRLLDPGAVERVLRNDASVCGTPNPAAFAKLHNLTIMHFLIRKRSVEELGQVQTTEIERELIERLKKSHADLAGGPSPE